MHPIIQQYVDYMNLQGFSASTVRSRARLLSGLGSPPDQASRDDVLRLLEKCSKNSSRRQYLNSLRISYRDMAHLGLVDRDPTLGLRTPAPRRGAPRPIPAPDVALLLTMRGHYRLWTLLGLRAGFRAMEVAQFAPEHLVYTDKGYAIIVPNGKGGKSAMVPAHQDLVEAFRGYEGVEGPLWPYVSRYISRRWRAEAEAVGVTGRRFHDLRHTFATNAYRASGHDLLVTRDLCRHSNVQSTQIYAGIEDERGYDTISRMA